MQKPGWIRFMDEMPVIGETVFVAYSSGPYNGMSWAMSGILIDNNNFKLNSIYDITLPLYDSENFDYERTKSSCLSYAHHWAYYNEENARNLNVKLICEYDRKMQRKSDHPIKCN